MVAGRLYPIYVEPIRAGRASKSDVGALYKHLSPFLRLDTISKFVMREVGSKDLAGRTAGSSLALSPYSRHLLIAGYLASRIPKSEDMRYFTKTYEDRGRPKVGTKQSLANNRSEPKPFLMDRLLEIFKAIYPGKVDPDDEIYTEIHLLTSMKLFSLVTQYGVLDSVKYKCIATPEFVSNISSKTKVDLSQFHISIH
eukprot:TRINITY_DN25314_c0_g1_i1.p1 TRINITY_DN25314_c0_g1~~TRINITY_DN25314_c0_g1_i1.p1  ORF type:complete len:197 (+),score=34.71 TRINITY_DN25314_c0_g1_i1:337-927(+)